jgi:GNAT superfamily N-acetyltransferase
MTEPRLRPAAPDDHERLRELTFESKAYWGYERDFVRRWADGLGFGSDCERWVAELDGAIVAWAALVPPADGVAVLDDLWVDPGWIGRGLGSRLFRLAVARGRKLRDHVSEWGRLLPWMGLDL